MLRGLIFAQDATFKNRIGGDKLITFSISLCAAEETFEVRASNGFKR